MLHYNNKMKGNLIYYPKWQEIVAYIYRNPGCISTEIYYDLKLSYAGISNIIKKLAEGNIIIKKKIGRAKILSIHPTHERFAKNISKIIK